MHPSNAASRRGGRPARAFAHAALTLAAALGLPAAATAACHLGTLPMPVTMVGSRAVIDVGIEGQQVPLMMDTGAFYSMLTEPAARQLGLRLRHAPDGLTVWGLTGILDYHVATVHKLQFGPRDLKDVEFMVGGNDSDRGVMGLLGRNLLGSSDIEFDLANGVINLVFPNADCDNRVMAYWARDTPVAELELVTNDRQITPAIEATVLVNGRKVRALFDTGAGSALSLKAAHDAGIKDADMTPGGVMLGVGTGRGKRWSAPMATIDFGGELIRNSRIEIGDFDEPGMLLGIDFFLSHHIYVSHKQKRIYITYNGGQVFALSHMATDAPVAASDTLPAQEDADAYARRGAARLARKDLAGALADLDRACEIAPQVAGYFMRRGEVRIALGQPDRALADFDVAARLDPTAGDALLARAMLHEHQQQPEAALADLQAMDRSIPRQSNLHAQMGQEYARLDQLASAIAQWTTWLDTHRVDVERGDVLNARCWNRVRLGVELEKALADCDDAIDQHDDDGAFFDSRAWVHLRRGEWHDARRDFDRALKLRPDGAWSFYGRGLLRARTGDAEGARADLETARKLRPDIDERVRHEGVAGDLQPPAPLAAAPAASGAAH